MEEFTVIELPNFDVNETEATVTGIKVENKQYVQKGQVVFQIENTKASEEIYAPSSGYVLLLCKIYDVKKMGDRLAAVFPSVAKLEEFDQSRISETETVKPASEEINATKKAIEMAEKLHIDLARIAARKEGSVIRVKDVQDFFEKQNSSAGMDRKMDAGRVFAYDRERVVIIGAGNGAEVVIDLLLDDYSKDIVGLVDDRKKKNDHYMYPVLQCGIGDFTERIDKNSYDTVIISIGSTLNSMDVRRRIFEDYREKGVRFTNAIAKSAEIRRGARIGTGNIIGSGCYIGTMTQIGDNNSISYGAYIGHHNQIGDHNLIAPGVYTSGSVIVGNSCILPAGVVTRNRLTIGNDVTLPVGYAVTGSLADHTVVRQQNSRKQ